MSPCSREDEGRGTSISSAHNMNVVAVSVRECSRRIGTEMLPKVRGIITHIWLSVPPHVRMCHQSIARHVDNTAIIAANVFNRISP